MQSKPYPGSFEVNSNIISHGLEFQKKCSSVPLSTTFNSQIAIMAHKRILHVLFERKNLSHFELQSHWRGERECVPFLIWAEENKNRNAVFAVRSEAANLSKSIVGVAREAPSKELNKHVCTARKLDGN